MSEQVPADQIIEAIVGARRHPVRHLARAVTSEQTVYILHSQWCKDLGIDLRDCPYSLALDRGIDVAHWREFEDRPVVALIRRGRLTPLELPQSVVVL